MSCAPAVFRPDQRVDAALGPRSRPRSCSRGQRGDRREDRAGSMSVTAPACPRARSASAGRSRGLDRPAQQQAMSSMARACPRPRTRPTRSARVAGQQRLEIRSPFLRSDSRSRQVHDRVHDVGTLPRSRRVTVSHRLNPGASRNRLVSDGNSVRSGRPRHIGADCQGASRAPRAHPTAASALEYCSSPSETTSASVSAIQFAPVCRGRTGHARVGRISCGAERPGRSAVRRSDALVPSETAHGQVAASKSSRWRARASPWAIPVRA